jgi:hypothetical protein
MLPFLVPGYGIAVKSDTMTKLRFWTSFLLILIFSALINQFVLDNQVFTSLGKIKRNYIELASVIITGLLGFIYFYKPKFYFFKNLWLFIYVASVLFLLVIAIVDNYIYSISKTNRQYTFVTLKEFLISPLLFIIFCVLEIVSGKSKKSS